MMMNVSNKPIVVPSNSPPSSPHRSSSTHQQHSSPTSSPIPSTVSAYLDDEDTLTSLSDDLAFLYTNFELRIATQPPCKTVYQRILKPFPTVVLTPKVSTSDDEGPALLTTLANAAASTSATARTASGMHRDVASLLNSAQHAGLFVEASLVRSDTGAPVAKCLDGNSMTRFERSSWNGGVLTATFKKLKILSTSQQLQGALLRIKFTLKKYTGATFATVNIPNRVILSQPIEVFSHSQYLHKKKEKRSRSDSVGCRVSDDDEQQQLQQAKEKVRRMEHDSVHVNLIAAIKAFKEQGGTKDMLVRCIDACYNDEDPRRHSSPSSFNQWEITMEHPARHHSNSYQEQQQHYAPSSGNNNNHSWQAQREAAAAIAFSTTTTVTTTTMNDDRRQAKGQESPQPCLPPLRQELGAVLQAAHPQPSQPITQRDQPTHYQRSHRGSLPDERTHGHHNYHSVSPPQRSHHSSFSSFPVAPPPPPRQPSNILPSLSSLLLLPPSSSPSPAQPVQSHRAPAEPAIASLPPSHYSRMPTAAAYPPRPLVPVIHDYGHDLGNKRKREHWTAAQPCTFV